MMDVSEEDLEILHECIAWHTQSIRRKVKYDKSLTNSDRRLLELRIEDYVDCMNRVFGEQSEPSENSLLGERIIE